MRSGPDWLPYFAPMLAFAGVLLLGDYAPAGYDLPLLALRVLAPGLAFLYFFRAQAYPELAEFRPGASALLDILVGLAVSALWVGPYLLWPDLRPEPAEGFNPSVAGEANRIWMLGLRLLGFALVTPFVEELLVRSYLIREAEVFNDDDPDFRRIPIGRFAWTGFLFTLVWFTFTHAQWEWPVAFAACVVYNLWLYRRKHIGSLVLAHATTNVALFFLVVSAPENLWFFL